MKSVLPENKSEWLKLRSEVITSTDVSALFDSSPYKTHFELWHEKKNKTVTEIKETDLLKWGNRLQDPIASGVLEDRGIKGIPLKEFIYDPELRIGSSFDWQVIEPFRAILEIKNVDSFSLKNNWIENEDGTYEAPAHIEFQVQHQMLVSGMEKAIVAALVGGNKVVTIEYLANKKVQDAILLKVKQFWASIDSNTPPKPNFETDSEFIASLFSNAQSGKTFIPTDETLDKYVKEYQEALNAEKAAEILKDAAKAKILMLIQDCDRAKTDAYTVSAGMIKESQISYTRKAYRSFKITWKGKNK